MDDKYTFDFSKMNIADIVFLSALDTHKPDAEQVARYFAMLGRVVIGLDNIPVEELPAVMHALAPALSEHVKLQVTYGEFVEALLSETESASDERCTVCGQTLIIRAGRCVLCGHEISKGLTFTPYPQSTCVVCKKIFPGQGDYCHNHVPAKPKQCKTCGHMWSYTQSSCPACGEEYER